MDHIARFLATIERRPVDHPATWLGIPDAAAQEPLCRHFGVQNLAQLIETLDDDMVPVELPYHSPVADAVYMALDFAKKGKVDRGHRTLNSPGFFEDCTDPARVADFDWPDPARHIDPAECRRVAAQAPRDRAVLGVVWSAHFQDACAAFGMENALMTLHTAPEMFRAVIDRILAFYLRANEIFYESTRGRLHAVLIGNDFGSQTGLLLSPAMVREFALPGTRRLVQQARSFGLKVIHHSCGSIHDIIPDLIEAGVDAIHPIQALAARMDAETLKHDFGHSVSFCGGVDAQQLLVAGSPDDVRNRVLDLRRLFPTGLVISPSHEAVLPDVPPANIAAMFEAARSPL